MDQTRYMRSLETDINELSRILITEFKSYKTLNGESACDKAIRILREQKSMLTRGDSNARG